jgi:hypothetical protein
VVGLSWDRCGAVGLLCESRGARQIPRLPPQVKERLTTPGRRTTNPTTPTTSQRKAHHTGTAHDKSHDKSHDNPTTLRQSFGCLRDHGGPKVRTFRGPLTSCRSTIYTDPPTLVATPTLNPTNSHHLDAPAASGQTRLPRRPSTDIETADAPKQCEKVCIQYHINSLLSGSVTLPPWRSNFVTFHQVAK